MPDMNDDQTVPELSADELGELADARAEVDELAGELADRLASEWASNSDDDFDDDDFDDDDDLEPLTIEEIMARKTRMVKTETVQLDGELAQKLIDLRDKINQAKSVDKMSNAPDAAPKLIAEFKALLKHAKRSETKFKFQSIGRPAYEKLLFENRPTQAQKKEGYGYNPDKFCPALVAASCISPVISPEAAREMFSDPNWNNAELLKLFLAANEVNTELADIPLSNAAIERMLDSVSKRTTAMTTESRTASSSGDGLYPEKTENLENSENLENPETPEKGTG